MSDENSADVEQPEKNISVEKNAQRNIIIMGDQNVINPAPDRLNMMTFAAVFSALALFLLIAWGVFLVISQGKMTTPTVLAPTTRPAQPPLQPNTWKVDLFDNLNLNGSPLQVFTLPAQKNDEGGYQISLTPQDLTQHISGMPANGYSLRLAGSFDFQAGYFEFHCEHHDGCRIYVDGYNWIDAWWDGGGGNDMARNIPAGKHLVMIEFYDKSGYGLLEVYWRLKP